jgi:hypothetical protein
MKGADHDFERVHKITTNFAAVVGQSIRSKKQTRRFNCAAGEDEMRCRNALEAAVGTSHQHRSDAVCSARLDAHDR